MSSNLKVNTILPSTGTTIGIGTVGGLINVVGNIDVNSTSGISTFNGLEISGIVTAKAGAAVTYYGDGSNLTNLPAQATIANNADNRVITGGSGVNLNAEANLKFDGTNLDIDSDSGHLRIGDDQDLDLYHNGSNGYLKNSTGQQLYRSGTHTFENAAGSTEYLRIDSAGKLLIGSGTITASYGGKLQLTNSNFAMNSFANNPHAQTFLLAKSRGTSGSGGTIVQDNDFCGHIEWYADDGVDTANQIAKISARINGTPGANDTPGELLFYTTADGANTSTERLSIASGGLITVNRDGVGGRIDATAGDASIKISDGNGRSSIKVSDPGSGNSYVWELTSAGNFKAPNGKGIDFSATADAPLSGASMSNELLDDYEEGLFTPSGFCDGGSVTNQSCKYTKIGKCVFIYLYVSSINIPNTACQWKLYGLPFTVSGSHYPALAVGYTGNGNLPGEIRFLCRANTSWIYSHSTAGTAAYLTNQGMRSYIQGQELLVTGYYFTDS